MPLLRNQPTRRADWRDIPVDDPTGPLDPRAANTLRRNGITTLGQAHATDLADLPGVGARLVQRIDEVLADLTGPHPAPTWDDRYEQVAHVIDAHHRYPAPGETAPDGHDLLGWLREQHTARHHGTLTAGRTAALEALPGWTWGPPRQPGRSPGHHLDTEADRWQTNLARLATYLGDHGALPSGSYRCPDDGFMLGDWIKRQRRAHADGTLVAGRTAALEALPGWTWDPASPTRHEQTWEGRRDQLAAYARTHRDTHPPRAYQDPDDGFWLGEWAANQRKQYQQGRLCADRAAALAEIPGWTWDPAPIHRRTRLPAHWEGRLDRLAAYLKEHGVTPPYSHTEPDGLPLGRWVANQRYAHDAGTLPVRQTEALEELPGWTWESPRATSGDLIWFGQRLPALVAYLDEHGMLPSNKHVTPDGFRLGVWMTNQRQAYRLGKLNPDRVHALEDTPGWTWRG